MKLPPALVKDILAAPGTLVNGKRPTSAMKKSAARAAGVASGEAWTRQVIKLAQACGWKVAHFRTVRILRANGTSHYATPVQADGAGFPDLILVRRRRVIAAELKAGKNQPRADQVAWLEAFRGASVEAYTWRPTDMNDIEAILA